MLTYPVAIRLIDRLNVYMNAFTILLNIVNTTPFGECENNCCLMQVVCVLFIKVSANIIECPGNCSLIFYFARTSMLDLYSDINIH